MDKLCRYGPSELSPAEVLVALLGERQEDTARDLLAEFDGLRGLSRATMAELEAVHGVGPRRAAVIVAAFELGSRLSSLAIKERVPINSPTAAAAQVQAEMERLDREEFWVLVLGIRMRVLTVDKLYRGSLNTIVVRVSEVFRSAIRHNAASIILAHNHPSGDLAPSPEDVEVTRRIVQAGKLLDIEVADHLIICAGGLFLSMKERGLGF